MSKRRSQPSDVLTLSGVAAGCADCGAERIFVPADGAPLGEFCCTSCDAAVFLLTLVEPAEAGSSRVA
jgi:hypothetical protein